MYFKKIGIVIILISIFLFSCQNKSSEMKGENKIISLFSIGKHNAIIDSILLANIGTMYWDGSHIYMCQAASPHIVVSTLDFGLSNHFSPQGEGPGESNALQRFAINDSLLAIYDNRRKSFSIFTKHGLFLRSIPARLNGPLLTNFAIIKDKLYFSNYTDHSTIEDISLSGSKVINTFCNEVYPSKLNSKYPYKRINNGRCILSFKDSLLLTIGKTQPFITLYSLSGNRLFNYDMNKIALIKKQYSYNIKKIEARPSNRSKSIALISDGKIKDSCLYLLVYKNYSNIVTCNTILKFVIDHNNKIVFTNSYLLIPSKFRTKYNRHKLLQKKYPWYNTFSIIKNKLIAYSPSKDKFDIYKLKDF